MNSVKFNLSHQPRLRPFKYEMAKRKEKWKAINDPIEKQLSIPSESQPAVVRGLVSDTTYMDLVSMLNLPDLLIDTEMSPSVDTIIPYIPEDTASEQADEIRESLAKTMRASEQSTLSGSSEFTSEGSEASIHHTGTSTELQDLIEIKSRTETTLESTEMPSDYVEFEKRAEFDRETMLKHKAILRFLNLPEAEAASWRAKDGKDVSDLSQMTLEEKGDYLINKIAVDFCKWIRDLGGDEKSFISEEIVKELFQIGMDNPATRAICMKTREKRVLYHNLATFLNMPDKSFHEVLLKHLYWDAEVEKKPSKVIAFGKSLPKNLRFKTPKNKTAETWLEWNKLSEEQLSFADVYKDIKDLRSTKEYCKWMAGHPEHKRPQYLVDQLMFDDSVTGRGFDEKSATEVQSSRTVMFSLNPRNVTRPSRKSSFRFTALSSFKASARKTEGSVKMTQDDVPRSTLIPKVEETSIGGASGSAGGGASGGTGGSGKKSLSFKSLTSAQRESFLRQSSKN